MRSDTAFKIATFSCLFLLFFFFLGIIFSVALYTDLETLISTFLSEEIIFSVQLSVVTATVATIVCLAVAVPAAYAISRSDFPGKSFVDTVLNIPIFMPPIALGAAMLIFFTPGTPTGEIGRFFVFQVPGIILAQFTVISALAIRLMKSTFDDVNPRYEDVARTLGYNKFQAFFKVTLPLCRNGLLAAIILSWTRALGEFGATVTLAGATRMKTETLSIAIYLSLASADVVKATVVILILAMIAIATLMIIQKFLGKGWSV